MRRTDTAVCPDLSEMYAGSYHVLKWGLVSVLKDVK